MKKRFNVSMSFSKTDIAGMLKEYESDCQTGMQIDEMAGLLYDYTSGYPFLVSKLCKLMDEKISQSDFAGSKEAAWTKNGFFEAERLLLEEKNTLFESLMGKLQSYPELDSILKNLLFTGREVSYNAYDPAIEIATMFGFIQKKNRQVAIANRIFETWLYNLYLSDGDIQGKEISAASQMDKNQFIVDGHLNMRRVLEKFVVHFHDLYQDSDEKFLEETGRKLFLLYLRPIINGTGNYYIEAQTRNLTRTDVIVDYRGEQYIIELKLWRGNEYHKRGEKQLVEYLEAYHVQKGYMLSFNFNKRKSIGVRDIVIDDKMIVEAVV